MAEFVDRWRWGLGSIALIILMFNLLSASGSVSAERVLKLGASSWYHRTEAPQGNFLIKAVNFLWQPGESGYHHVWPVSSSFDTKSFWFLDYLCLD